MSVIVKVYNHETQSWMFKQMVYNKVQTNSNIEKQEGKIFKKHSKFWNQILWTEEKR